MNFACLLLLAWACRCLSVNIMTALRCKLRKVSSHWARAIKQQNLEFIDAISSWSGHCCSSWIFFGHCTFYCKQQRHCKSTSGSVTQKLQAWLILIIKCGWQRAIKGLWFGFVISWALMLKMERGWPGIQQDPISKWLESPCLPLGSQPDECLQSNCLLTLNGSDFCVPFGREKEIAFL